MRRLVANELKKSYPTPSGELIVFENLSLALEAGEAIAITGPSGCGKSTLLHCLGTLDPPTSGTVLIDGKDPYQFKPAGLADFRNRTFGFIFQDHYLLPQITAIQNVLVPALARGSIDAATTERARQLLDKVGLGQRIDHLPSQLSGGERARVSIARALLLNPQIVLADEPTGSLDPSSASVVADLLLQLQQTENVSLVVVTHSLELANRLPRQLKL